MADMIRDLIDRRALLQGLLAHPGWHLMLEFKAQDRANIMGVTMDQPCSSAEEIYRQEFIKGRCLEIKLLPDFPQAIIDNLTIEIDSLMPEEKLNDDRTGRTPDDTDGDNLADPNDRAP